MTLSTTRGHLFRAVLESVAFGFRHHVEVFRELGQAPRPGACLGRRRELSGLEADHRPT